MYPITQLINKLQNRTRNKHQAVEAAGWNWRVDFVWRFLKCPFFLFSLIYFCVCASVNAQDLNQLTKEKPVRLFGSFGVGGWVYHRGGQPIQDFRGLPYNWYLNGSPTLQVYGFTFPFSFTVSEQQRDFSQPFNQYGVSPYYKWATAHIGYRNMHFSDYTLAGQTFLGAGLEINPGKFRLGLMYGRFRKAVELDTARSATDLPNIIPTYKRMGMAAKIGVGNKSNFIDFIVFKGWDDETSLKNPVNSIILAPGENLNTGVKMNLRLFKQLYFDLDVAGSAVTLDKRRIDTISIINDEIPAALRTAIPLNYSTHFYLAGHGSVTYRTKQFSLRAMYKYVEPDYQSFGSNFIQGDLRDITLSPSLHLVKGKVHWSASLGQRTDNLGGYKLATTKRTLISSSLNATISPSFGVGLSYGNFGMNAQNARVLLNDSIRVSTVNQTIGANFRYQKAGDQKTTMIVGMFNYSNMDDRNEVTARFTASKVLLGNLNYALNLPKKFITFSLALNATRVQTRLAEVWSAGPNAGVTKSNKKQTIRASLNAGYQIRFQNEASDGGILNVNTDLSFLPNKKHALSLLLNVLQNTSSAVSVYAFNEQRITMRYMYHF